jgi:L-amino acid N-acyltransferase YncA
VNPSTYRIDRMILEDWPSVRGIWAEGIATCNATLDSEVSAWEDWDTAHLSRPRLVARVDGSVVGWAALSPASKRRAYAGVAEVSVYVAASAQRAGIGHALVRRLVAESELDGLWTLQAVVFPTNPTCVRLLERCGFRRVGVRERIGRLHGVWRDVLLLERRSPEVGS